MARPPEGRYGVGGGYPKPPPYTPPPPPNFGGGGGGTSGGTQWWTPDPLPQTKAPAPLTIDQILAKNAGFLAFQGQLGAESIADAASRDAALRRALIDFGMAIDPSQLGGDTAAAVQGVLDPQTRALIDKNTAAGMSMIARLRQQAADTRKSVVDTLAGRGMYRSGETGYGLQRAQAQADQQRYDATKQVLDYIAGVQAGFVAAERERQRLLDAQRQKVIDDYEPEPEPPPPPYGGVGAAPVLGPITPGVTMPTSPSQIPLFGGWPKPKPKPKPPPKFNPPGFIGGV